MNGHILNGIPIAVDCFNNTAIAKAKLFFLTHMHSDHTVGLSSKWNRTIYCSQITARLLNYKFNISQKYIEVLEPSQPHLLTCGDVRLTVQMFDANHCPGSCVYVFVFTNRKIVYTGDFRYDDCSLWDDFKLSCDHLWPIDLLYLDNTYCEPTCCFPTRAEAIDMIITICKKHPDHRILVGTSWVGHEHLLVQLSIALKEFVYVSEDFYERLKLLEAKDVFRKGKSQRLNAVPNDRVTCNAIRQLNEEMPTIGIKPTAMYGGQCKILNGSEGHLYVVPYSNHCNYVEMTEFVKMVRPVTIKPVVPGRKLKQGMESYFRADMRQFSQYLTSADKSSSDFVSFVKEETTDVFPAEYASPKKLKGKVKRKFIQHSRRFKPLHRGVQFNSNDTESIASPHKSPRTVMTAEELQAEIENEIVNSPDLWRLLSTKVLADSAKF